MEENIGSHGLEESIKQSFNKFKKIIIFRKPSRKLTHLEQNRQKFAYLGTFSESVAARAKWTKICDHKDYKIQSTEIQNLKKIKWLPILGIRRSKSETDFKFGSHILLY